MRFLKKFKEVFKKPEDKKETNEILLKKLESEVDVYFQGLIDESELWEKEVEYSFITGIQTLQIAFRFNEEDKAVMRNNMVSLKKEAKRCCSVLMSDHPYIKFEIYAGPDISIAFDELQIHITIENERTN
jgi:hypothetical protein